MKLRRLVAAVCIGLMGAGAAWAGTIDYVGPGAGLSGVNTHGPNVRLNVGAGPGITVYPNKVGVSFAGTSCPSGYYLSGFDIAGTPVCTALPSIQPPLANQECFDGFFLKGFDAEGELICKVLPGYFDLGVGLVAYYPFNGNANDESGGVLHGTVSGALLTTDRHGDGDSAYWFDGVDDGIITTTTTFTIPATISCWFQSTAVNDILDSLINWTNVIDLGEGFSLLAQGDGRIHGKVGALASNVVGTSYPDGDGQWHLATLTRSADSLSLYIDGELETTIATTESVGDNHVFYIGRSIPTSNIYSWSGKIDEVRVYNRALSAPEVKALYQLP
jgi:hypothetical protein